MTLAALKNKLVPQFLPSLSQEDLEEKAREYNKRWNFPNCVGAIDGKHVRIKCPPKSISLYYNYRGFYSIILLAIVDANYKFMYIDVGSYGKEGDSGVFEKSVMGQKFYNGTLLPPSCQLPNSELLLPYVLVGDDAFRLHPNMMKPYLREEAIGNNTKSVFNYRSVSYTHLDVYKRQVSWVTLIVSTFQVLKSIHFCVMNIKHAELNFSTLNAGVICYN